MASFVAPPTADLDKPAGIGKLNGFLGSRSYVFGYQPTQADVDLYNVLADVKVDNKKSVHVARFLKHMNDFTKEEREAWPKASADSDDAPVAEKEAEEEEDDLFGSDDEDEEAVAALNAKLAAEKAARKAGKGKGERSLIVLEVKPFESEFDLNELAKSIKKIEHEGIQNWGLEYKLVPVAFGIKKLQISVVVYDDLVGVDLLTELIEDNFGDDVQSVDVFAMSKV